MHLNDPVGEEEPAASTLCDRVLLIVMLALLVFTGIRAYVLSITHDEVLSALIHAKAPLGDIFAHSVGTQGANNHLLNTLLMKFFSSFFGDGEIILRLPALIGHSIYLIAIYRLCSFFFQGWRRILSVLLLITSPFLVDFFSCARGYSLGIGFSMLALSVVLPLLASSHRISIKRFIVFIVLIDLAVLSNVIFTNMLIALVLVILISDIYLAMTGGSKLMAAAGSCLHRFIVPLIAGAIPLLVIYRPEVVGRIRAGMGGYGGKNGLWQDTVQTLVECSLYDRSYPLITTVSIMAVIAFFVIVGILISLYKTNTNNSLAKNAQVTVISIILLVCFVMVVQFHLFSVPYAVDRSALFLIPLYLLYLLLLFDYGSKIKSRLVGIMIMAVTGLFLGLLLMHQVSCLNLTHYYLWRFDASAKDAMQRISDLGRKDQKRPRTIGVTWQLEPAMNYYRFRFGVDWIPLIDRSSPDGEYDVYYVAQHERYVVEKRELTAIEEYPISGCVLALSPKYNVAP